MQLKRVLLKGLQTDVSYLRERLSLDVDYSMNGYCQRSSYGLLKINGMNFGLFQMTEDIDTQVRCNFPPTQPI